MFLGITNGLPSMDRIVDNAALNLNLSGMSNFSDGITFSRGSDATMIDANGNLVYAPANLECNAFGSGAVVGVLGSGGALPTLWSLGAAIPPGMTIEVVGTGELNGYYYVDVKWSGTNSGADAYPHIYFHPVANAVVVNPGEIYTVSHYVHVIDGNVSGSSGRCLMQLYTGAGAYVTSLTGAMPITNVESRQYRTGTIVATVGKLQHGIYISIPNGQDNNFTLRISRPMTERTSVNSPSKWYPTTGTTFFYGGRFEYDPNTLTSLGYLSEEQKTNLALVSTAFTVDTGTSTVASGATMLGQACYRTTADGTSSTHFVTNASLTLTGATEYTTSVFVKSISGDNLIQLTVSANATTTDVYANFNLSTGAVTASGVGATKSRIVNYGNGVYRLSITFTTVAVPTAGSIIVLSTVANGTSTRIPTNTSSNVFDWFGCQVETGKSLTSLIPTFGTALTRSADSAIFTDVSWLDQTKGTFVVNFIPRILDGSTLRRVISVTDAGALNTIEAGTSSAAVLQLTSAVAGVTSFAPTSANTCTENTPAKFALVYSSGGKTVCLNGGAVSSNATSPTLSGYTLMKVGFAGSTTYLDGHIKSIKYWKTSSFSNAVLQQLTT